MNRNTRQRFFRPSLEALEARWTPAITPIDCNPDVAGNDSVRILGTAGADRVIINDNPAADTVTYQHDVGNNGSIDFTLTTSTLDYCVEVDLLAGNDVLVYTVFGDYSGYSKRLSVALGAGNDRVNFNSGGFDFTNSTEWVIEIADAPTAGGNDKVFLHFASPNSQATDTNILNSALSVDVELGAGLDEATVTFDGDIGDSVGDYDTAVDIAISLGTEDDKFAGLFDLAFFDIFNDGALSLLVNGGSHNDQIRVQRHPSFSTSGPASIEGVFDLNLQGRYGNDLINVDFNTASANEAFTSSQLGNIRVRVSGDDGNDNLQVRLSNDQFATLNYDVLARGGVGADSLGLSIVAEVGSTVTYGALGYGLLDGGLGFDTLLFRIGNVQRRSV
jgi:hypothetical protein